MHHTNSFMKPVPIAAILLALAVASSQGQDGFRYAKAQGAPKVAKSAPVVRAAKAPEIVKTWEVNQSGEPSDGLTPGVERIEWFADRMRWHFTVLNRNETPRGFLFDMKSSYVADGDGETYEVTGRELQNNHNQYHVKDIQPGTRFKFWLDFAVPKRETQAFKVGLLGEFTHNFNRMRPFTVKLTEPVGGDPAASPVQAIQGEEKGELGLKEIIHDEERPGGMTREVEPSRGTAPQPSNEAAQAVRAAPRDGRRYEGSIKSYAGGEAAGGILFERRSKDRLLSARIYTKTTPARETKIVGAIFEDISAPGGLVFRFEDSQEVEYLFRVEGGNFSGTSSRGDRYTFMYKK